MYELTDTTVVDLDAERAAIVAHIEATWTPIEGLAQIVEDTQKQAFIRGRAWFDKYVVGKCAWEASKDRSALLNNGLPTDEERQTGQYYDKAASVLQYMFFRADELREVGLNLDGPWRYDKVSEAVYQDALTRHPKLAKARPLGWNELARDYSDFAGMEEYDHKTATANFNGADTASAGAEGFVSRTALPYVMYDEVCQGRRAALVLVSAIFSHFLRIIEHINTQGMVGAIAALETHKLPLEVIHDLPLMSDNLLLRALIAVAEFTRNHDDPEARGAEGYARALKDLREFEALPEEEKAKRKAENKVKFDEIMASLDSAEARQRKQDEAAYCRNVLLELLPA